MKRNWQPEELIEHWTLLPSELALLVNKTDHNRLGFALLLKFFQYAARFPNHDTQAGIEESSSPLTTPLAALKADPGRIGLDSLQKEVAKLQLLRQLALPDKLFERVSSKVLQTYRQRVAVEPPRELRRHPAPRRYTFLAAFCWLRSQEITDNLVELLISIIHRIGARAEQRVEKELLDDFKRVSGKTGLLFRLAEAALNQPDGVVREVVYPVVGEQTLKNLVREFKSSGNAYREKVYTVMRSSYSNHYRRMVPLLLCLLEFRSNNEVHRPVIQALELLKKYTNSKQRYYDATEEIPIEGILSSSWQSLILETGKDGSVKVNRINYEFVGYAQRNGLTSQLHPAFQECCHARESRPQGIAKAPVNLLVRFGNEHGN